MISMMPSRMISPILEQSSLLFSLVILTDKPEAAKDKVYEHNTIPAIPEDIISSVCGCVRYMHISEYDEDAVHEPRAETEHYDSHHIHEDGYEAHIFTSLLKSGILNSRNL